MYSSAQAWAGLDRNEDNVKFPVLVGIVLAIAVLFAVGGAGAPHHATASIVRPPEMTEEEDFCCG